MEETSKHGVLGRYQTCSKERIKFYQTRSNAIIIYNKLPAYCISKSIKMATGGIIYKKVYASPQPPPKISFKVNWMKELGSEVAGGGKDSQQTQQKTTNPIVRTRRPVTTEQTSRSSAQEIDTPFLLGCESTNVSTERLVNSCVPVSVERSDQDKDADDNEHADQVRTGRPVDVQK